jgi:D-3-phosphoglycerate dehydrogenase
MKVLVCDPVSEDCVTMMKDAGIEVTVKTDMTPDELKTTVPGFEGMVVRGATKVTKEVIDAATDLKVVIRGGVGLDNIDQEAAKTKNVAVLNTPEASTDSVSELTVGMMFALARGIPQATASLKDGKWEKKAFKGFELQGKTLGLIGIGRIGLATATRACVLGMKVIACDPYVKECPDCVNALCSPKGVFTEADIISIHTPLTDETRHMISATEFEMMKDGVCIINCARGGIIDESALYDAIKSGKVAGAALDVFEKEPPQDKRLLELPQVIGTPHVGAQTKEASGRVGSAVAAKVIAFCKENP